MSFHNGVPITVVGGTINMPTSAESSSRRRAEQDESVTPNVARAACKAATRKVAG